MANLVTIGNTVLCREHVDWSAVRRPITRIMESTRIRAKSVTDVQKFSGYEVRTEMYDGNEFGCEDFEVKSAYSNTGIYLGDPGMAKYLVGERGIKPMLADSKHCVASIGFQEEECKWYGWSHRAMCGFTLGERIFDENYRGDLPERIRDKIPFVQHGEQVIYTMDQMKLSAKNFARYVS